MSEHRSNEVTYTLGKSMKAALMLEDLRKQKECSLYPDCACHQTLVRFQEKLPDAGIVWTTDELSGIETVIFCSLECLSRYCPDPVVKAYAQRQLSNPWWDAQRRIEELTEPDCARIAAGGRR